MRAVYRVTIEQNKTAELGGAPIVREVVARGRNARCIPRYRWGLRGGWLRDWDGQSPELLGYCRQNRAG
jgi:hypothetical protein